jgi:hypothetical protein
MGDFVTNSQTSLSALMDQCNLLQNVMHDVLVLEVGSRLDQVPLPCIPAPTKRTSTSWAT